MRIREPKTTALIFASGKMVVTGAKSEDDSKLAARKYARIIQKLGFQAKFTDFKIQNIVGSCDVRFPIRLEGLAYSHGHFSSVSDGPCGMKCKWSDIYRLVWARTIPWPHLPYGQTEDCPLNLRLGQDCSDWSESPWRNLPSLPSDIPCTPWIPQAVKSSLQTLKAKLAPPPVRGRSSHELHTHTLYYNIKEKEKHIFFLLSSQILTSCIPNILHASVPV